MGLQIGDRVRLRADASMVRHHPALVGAEGVIGAVVRGPQWARLASSPAERAADLRVHIRFAHPSNLVLLNVEGAEVQRLVPPAG